MTDVDELREQRHAIAAHVREISQEITHAFAAPAEFEEAFHEADRIETRARRDYGIFTV